MARKKRKEEEALAIEQGLPVPEKQVPRTIENQREIDETMITEVDEELMAGEQQDEFSGWLQENGTTNKYLILLLLLFLGMHVRVFSLEEQCHKCSENLKNKKK